MRIWPRPARRRGREAPEDGTRRARAWRAALVAGRYAGWWLAIGGGLVAVLWMLVFWLLASRRSWEVSFAKTPSGGQVVDLSVADPATIPAR